jgi:hypothetical protein
MTFCKKDRTRPSQRIFSSCQRLSGDPEVRSSIRPADANDLGRGRKVRDRYCFDTDRAMIRDFLGLKICITTRSKSAYLSIFPNSRNQSPPLQQKKKEEWDLNPLVPA